MCSTEALPPAERRERAGKWRPRAQGCLFPGSPILRAPYPKGPSTQQSYTLQNPNLHNYYPKTEYLIIGSFGPLGLYESYYFGVIGPGFLNQVPTLWSPGSPETPISRN